jgi:hypothetical protein
MISGSNKLFPIEKMMEVFMLNLIFWLNEIFEMENDIGLNFARPSLDEYM